VSPGPPRVLDARALRGRPAILHYGSPAGTSTGNASSKRSRDARADFGLLYLGGGWRPPRRRAASDAPSFLRQLGPMGPFAGRGAAGTGATRRPHWRDPCVGVVVRSNVALDPPLLLTRPLCLLGVPMCRPTNDHAPDPNPSRLEGGGGGGGPPAISRDHQSARRPRGVAQTATGTPGRACGNVRMLGVTQGRPGHGDVSLFSRDVIAMATAAVGALNPRPPSTGRPWIAGVLRQGIVPGA